VWDDGISDSFVTVSAGGQMAKIHSRYQVGRNVSKYMAICSKYQIGDAGVDTKWTIQFNHTHLIAIGLVARSSENDLERVVRGDFNASVVRWVSFCPHPYADLLFLPGPAAGNDLKLENVEAKTVMLSGDRPTPGEPVSLEFQFSPTTNIVSLISLNGSRFDAPFLVFHGPGIATLTPYFAISQPLNEETVHIK